MTAFACAAAGLKPILLEADRVGLGGSGRATGLLSGEAAESFREVEARAGRRVARALFSAMESAPRDLAATVKRLGIKAGLKVGPGLRVIPPNQTDKALRKELAAREAAASTASFLTPAAIAQADRHRIRRRHAHARRRLCRSVQADAAVFSAPRSSAAPASTNDSSDEQDHVHPQDRHRVPARAAPSLRPTS